MQEKGVYCSFEGGIRFFCLGYTVHLNRNTARKVVIELRLLLSIYYCFLYFGGGHA